MRTVGVLVTALSLGACAAQHQSFAPADLAAQSKPNLQTAQTSLTQRIVDLHPVVYNASEGPPQIVRAHEPFAVAASVPTLNPETSCHLADKLAVNQNVDHCLVMESKARDELAHKWSDFPSADRSHCMRYSSGGTYTDLLTCLELELDVRNLHAKNSSVAAQ
jgi:hypothetical protein